MTAAITRFESDYFFLSNFFIHPVRYKRKKYRSNEHGFQAAKFLDPAVRRMIASYLEPNDAKKAGQAPGLRPDWETVKLKIMAKLVHRKFKDPVLRAKLLATGDAELIEGNWWSDFYWGVCKGRGENHLGRILMTERDSIRKRLARRRA